MELPQLYEKYLHSSGITTDTRSISEDNIFFALKGEKYNANLFAAQALEKKAAYAVVDEAPDQATQKKYGERLIIVQNVLQTLQQLAGYHRQQSECPWLAITGSNGKTTTKELIAAVLAKKFKTYATKGNLNNHIGIPLTMLSVKNDAEFVIIEMGANHLGEIASYCEYVKPDYGLITNVGLAHIEGFGSFNGVIKGKTELYRDLVSRHRKIFVSADNSILLDHLPTTADTITYGKSSTAFCKGEIVSTDELLTLLTEGVKIKTNLVGDYNFENVMSAVCVAKYFGVPVLDIKVAIESYVPSNNRSQKVLFGTNTIILDAYNANPSSMSEALKNFEKLMLSEGCEKRSLIILGEMMELGEYATAEHEKIAEQVSSTTWQQVKKVFVGKGFEYLNNPEAVQRLNHAWWFKNTRDAKEWFDLQKLENHLILIKGSRRNELEKLLTK